MRKLYPSDIIRLAQPIDTFRNNPGVYFLVRDKEIIEVGFADDNPMFYIIDVDVDKSATHAYIIHCDEERANQLVNQFKTTKKVVTKPKETTKPIVIIDTTKEIVTPKTPITESIKPIQIIKNQPLRTYTPRPNPNKARWDKLKESTQ